MRVEDLNRDFINKSRKYLWQAFKFLKCYGMIIPALNNVVCVGAGIKEVIGLTLYFDTSKVNVNHILEAVGDEMITQCIVSENIHAIVFKAPIDVGAFLKGEYSKIYSPEQLSVYEGPSKPVLCRTEDAYRTFIQAVEKKFNAGSAWMTDETRQHLKNNEYDFPPIYSFEILYSDYKD